ncbi:unnamed protein product [Chrysoparadoxa australica]
MIATPGRELAVQIAREAVLLLGGDTSVVHVLVDSKSRSDLTRVGAPILVGSAKAITNAVKRTKPWLREEVLQRVQCIVADEVDRLVDNLSKYATHHEKEARGKHPRPITKILTGISMANPDVQVVACSATVGRPLLRELAKLVGKGQVKGAMPVIRDASVAADITSHRAVTVAPSLKHWMVPLRGEGMEGKFNALMVLLEELQPKKPLVFVPPEEKVSDLVREMQMLGLRGAQTLHEAFGFETGENVHFSENLEKHNQLSASFSVSTGVRAPPPILVTSVDAARGLHFDDVDYVFILSRPKDPDEYVHLSGRTGRQGNPGEVVSIVSYREGKGMRGWETQLGMKFEEMPIVVE